jgi:hypothetical protein
MKMDVFISQATDLHGDFHSQNSKFETCPLGSNQTRLSGVVQNYRFVLSRKSDRVEQKLHL